MLTDIDAMLEEILRTAQIRTLTRRFAPPSPGGRGKGAHERNPTPFCNNVNAIAASAIPNAHITA